MQHPVSDVVGDVVLDPSRLLLELAVEVDRAGDLEEGTQERVQAGVAVLPKRRLVEPADAQPQAPGDTQQVVRRKREPLAARLLGGTLEVGKPVLVQLLVRADEQVGELASGGAALGQQFRDGGLQQLAGEQEPRFQRHPPDPAAAGRRLDVLLFQCLVEEPANVFLENVRDHAQQAFRRHALPVLDHRQVGHGRTVLAVQLDTADRQILQRQVVPLAQVTNLGAEEMRLAHEALGGLHRSPCEINNVKFLV